MIGDFAIDSVNAYGYYGVYVERGGWNGLMSFPSLKEPEKNDWHEYNGLEVDLDKPVLNSREFQMSLVAQTKSGFDAFTNALGGANSIHTLSCFGRSFQVRLTNQPSLSLSRGLARFQVKFADDNPLDLSTADYTAPSSSVFTGGDIYTLGGLGSPSSRRLSAYGITVLSGSNAEVSKKAEVKKNLLVNIATQSGASYDNSTVRYQAKDVRLSCLMRAATMAELWRNSDALLYDLVRPNARTMNGHSCYYKSMAVSEFFPEDRPWMKFALTLCFI